MAAPPCPGLCRSLPVQGSLHRHEDAAQQLGQQARPLVAHAGAGAAQAQGDSLPHKCQLCATCMVDKIQHFL